VRAGGPRGRCPGGRLAARARRPQPSGTPAPDPRGRAPVGGVAPRADGRTAGGPGWSGGVAAGPAERSGTPSETVPARPASRDC